MALVLTASSTADVHVFPPRKVRSLCGVVLVEDLPIEGATVSLQSQKEDQTISEVETNKDGRYQFKSVPKGKYWLHIKSFVGSGVVFVHLTKNSGSVCKELIETRVRPAVAPDDENNSIVPVAPGLMVTPLPVSECPNETVAPNLELTKSTHVFGALQDQTTAAFAESKILLRRYQTPSMIVDVKTVTTNAKGNFDLGTLSAGKYRLLSSPTRAFAQPEKLECWGQQECKLDITLMANPTDLPYAACPVK